MGEVDCLRCWRCGAIGSPSDSYIPEGWSRIVSRCNVYLFCEACVIELQLKALHADTDRIARADGRVLGDDEY